MPALIKTDYIGEVVHLGYMPEMSDGRVKSSAVEAMDLSFRGFVQDAHYGLTRPSCVRVRTQYEVGTQIKNVRQLSILSQEEMDAIAADLGLDALDPVWLGATVVVKGIPDFTHIPPSSRLQVEREGGATLTVDMLNQPCHIVSRTIEDAKPGQGQGFKQAAEERRGVTAWVEAEGSLRLGDKLRLHIPGQRAWSH